MLGSLFIVEALSEVVIEEGEFVLEAEEPVEFLHLFRFFGFLFLV